jgi:hypothetical protein
MIHPPIHRLIHLAQTLPRLVQFTKQVFASSRRPAIQTMRHAPQSQRRAKQMKKIGMKATIPKGRVLRTIVPLKPTAVPTAAMLAKCGTTRAGVTGQMSLR